MAATSAQNQSNTTSQELNIGQPFDWFFLGPLNLAFRPRIWLTGDIVGKMRFEVVFIFYPSSSPDDPV